MQEPIVRRFCLIIVLLACGLLAVAARGETYKLTTGQELNGEVLPTSANEQGVQVKVGDGQYEKVLWTSFSQEDLKKFAKNSKLEPLVEPFIEITQEDKIKKTEVTIKPVPRLEHPAGRSLIGGLFGSGLGVFIVLLVYAANIYAGYEVAIFRAQPPYLVAGLAAIPALGFIAPIVFLAMPTKMKPSEAAAEAPPEGEPVAAEAGAAVAGEDAANPMLANGAAHPAGLKLAHTEAPAGPSLPQTVVFQRGQYTFNRRFIETKFPNFFGVVRRDADKDMVLLFKTARGEYVGQRISRIAANDLHVQVQHGAATQEVMIPFLEIQEIQMKHKDAK